MILSLEKDKTVNSQLILYVKYNAYINKANLTGEK